MNASLLLKYFGENFRIISASFINVNENYTQIQFKKITVLVLAWLKEYLSSNVPVIAPEMQNAPLPGHGALLGPFLDCPSHLDVFILSTTSCWCSFMEQAQWHKLLHLRKARSLLHVFAPAVSHAALAEIIAAGYGYLWGGDLIINWKSNRYILNRVTLYKSYSRI